jgi:hypothetical protein
MATLRVTADDQDDWDVSDDDKPKPKATTTTTTASAPIKKKKTLKQVLAEKEKKAAEAVSCFGPPLAYGSGASADSAEGEWRRRRSHQPAHRAGQTAHGQGEGD